MESFERAVGLHEEGHSDCANRGTITKQDVAVATGVVGVLSGGMALAAGTTAAGAAVTVAGILNSADDIGTNAKGESFLQQQVNTQSGKADIGNIKTIVSSLGVINNINTLRDAGSTIVQKATSIADSFNSIANNLNSLFNE